MSLNLRSRFTASFIHLIISASIFALLTFVLIKLWYPSPFFTASGGWQGLKMVALISIILGPLLTLIVFNTKKSKLELSIDISLIACLQIAALIWGSITIYNERPVAAVFWYDAFYTVPAKALEKQGYNLDDLSKLDSHTPAIIFARPPTTLEEQLSIINTSERENIPPHHQVNLYRPYKEYASMIFATNVNIHEIVTVNPDMKVENDEILNREKSSLEENHYISLVSRYKNIILVFNNDAELLGTASSPYKDQ